MKSPQVARVAALIIAALVGMTFGGCGKTRSLTGTLELKPNEADVVVSSVTLAVEPASYQGECPADFYLVADITVKDSCAVIYRWEFSNGLLGPRTLLWFEEAGSQRVWTRWNPGAPGSYWGRLHVLHPDDVDSNPADFVNQCATFNAWATAGESPGNYSGACPGNFAFSGRISTNGRGAVRYRWEGSDGHIGPVEHLDFDGAGSKEVQFSRSIITHGSLTERVHILEPRDTLSAAVSFSNACEGAAVQVSDLWAAPSGDPCEAFFVYGANITTNVAEVTYRWERSDGDGPVETLNFASPGTQPVTMSWQIPGESAWARLHVLTPVDAQTIDYYVWYDCCWMCGAETRMRKDAAQRARRANR